MQAHGVHALWSDTLADEAHVSLSVSLRNEGTAPQRSCTCGLNGSGSPGLDVVACTQSKAMAHPRKGYGPLVKRASQCSKGGSLYVQVWEFQDNTAELLQTDSGGVTCRSTRRSSSGGPYQGRQLRIWARVVLRSREGELYAQIRGPQEMLSRKYLMEELRPCEYRTLKYIGQQRAKVS